VKIDLYSKLNGMISKLVLFEIIYLPITQPIKLLIWYFY